MPVRSLVEALQACPAQASRWAAAGRCAGHAARARLGRLAAGTPRSGLGPHVEALLAELRLPGAGRPPARRDLRLDPLRSRLDRRRVVAVHRLTVCSLPYAEPFAQVAAVRGGAAPGGWPGRRRPAPCWSWPGWPACRWSRRRTARCAANRPGWTPPEACPPTPGCGRCGAGLRRGPSPGLPNSGPAHSFGLANETDQSCGCRSTVPPWQAPRPCWTTIEKE
jgi:Family of unknown function (DUF5682)